MSIKFGKEMTSEFENSLGNMQNNIFEPKSPLKPYCQDQDYIPKFAGRITPKKHITISDNSNETHRPRYKFKVDKTLLEGLVDLNDISNWKPPCMATVVTKPTFLPLTRSKTVGVKLANDLSIAPKPLARAKSQGCNNDSHTELGLVRVLNRKDVLFLRFGEEIKAIHNKCPHKGGEIVNTQSNEPRLHRSFSESR